MDKTAAELSKTRRLNPLDFKSSSPTARVVTKDEFIERLKRKFLFEEWERQNFPRLVKEREYMERLKNEGFY